MEDFTPDCLTINGERYWREDAARRLFEQTPGVERLYKVAEVSDITGLSKSTLYRLMESGHLRYVVPNGLERGRMMKLGWVADCMAWLSESSTCS